MRYTVYADKSFTFVTKEPPVANLIFGELKLSSGSGNPNREKVGTISREQAAKIAKRKMADMGVDREESAIAMVVGTAKSMGIDFEDEEMRLTKRKKEIKNRVNVEGSYSLDEAVELSAKLPQSEIRRVARVFYEARHRPKEIRPARSWQCLPSPRNR